MTSVIVLTRFLLAFLVLFTVTSIENGLTKRRIQAQGSNCVSLAFFSPLSCGYKVYISRRGIILNKEQLRILIGENIRKERLTRGMTIEQLSETLGQSPGFVDLIERGKRGVTSYTLLKLAEVFKVSIDSFFGHAHTNP